jgi:hypothetical protein
MTDKEIHDLAEKNSDNPKYIFGFMDGWKACQAQTNKVWDSMNLCECGGVWRPTGRNSRACSKCFKSQDNI